MPLSKRTTCEHGNLKLVHGGFECLDCGRKFWTHSLATDGKVFRGGADTTAILHAVWRRLDELTEAVKPLKRAPETSWSSCRRCNQVFPSAQMKYNDSWEHLCPKCDAVVRRETPENVKLMTLKRFTDGKVRPVEAKVGLGPESYREGQEKLLQAKQQEADEIEHRSAPGWAWDFIDAALEHAADDKTVSENNRRDISRAVEAMEIQTAWNSNIMGKES